MCKTIEKLISGYKCDTILKFEKEEIKTHKEILCDNSDFFKTFYDKWDHEKNGVMSMIETNIKDLDIFREILRLWYYDNNQIICEMTKTIIFKDYINYLGAKPFYYIPPQVTIPSILLEELGYWYTTYDEDQHSDYCQKLIVDGKQVPFNGDYINIFKIKEINDIIRQSGFIDVIDKTIIAKKQNVFDDTLCYEYTLGSTTKSIHIYTTQKKGYWDERRLYNK